MRTELLCTCYQQHKENYKATDPTLSLSSSHFFWHHRRLIRVKMADEGDLQQAVQAMRLLSTFVAEVEGKTPMRYSFFIRSTP